MGLFVALILVVIGGILLFSNSNYHLPRSFALPAIGFILILAASYCLGSMVILENDIKEREQVITFQETVTYELVPFKFATSEAEIEHSDNINTYYIHTYEHDQLHFYYKTNQNGSSGFSQKTICASNIFITEGFDGAPIVLEITTTYEQPMNKFEKWWIINDFCPTTVVKYKIYVPANSIIETFSPE